MERVRRIWNMESLSIPYHTVPCRWKQALLLSSRRCTIHNEDCFIKCLTCSSNYYLTLYKDIKNNPVTGSIETTIAYNRLKFPRITLQHFEKYEHIDWNKAAHNVIACGLHPVTRRSIMRMIEVLYTLPVYLGSVNGTRTWQEIMQVLIHSISFNVTI